MSKLISLEENGLNLVFYVTDDKLLRFLHFSTLPFDEGVLTELNSKRFLVVELQATGENQHDHHGSKHTATSPGDRLKYNSHKDYRNQAGRKLELIQTDGGNLKVISHFQFHDGTPVVRCWTEVSNTGSESVGLEYVSSFALTGISQNYSATWAEISRLHIGHNDWCGEGQWISYTLPELGLSQVKDFSTKRIEFSSTGSWPTGEYMSMGLFEDIKMGTFLFWEIEHNGSWAWELGPVEQHLYLQLSGPCERENHWWKSLAPGESFCSVPVSVGTIKGSFDDAIGALTCYRRAIRRPNHDNEKLSIVFDDYMYSLWAEPTTAKLLPLIDVAEEIGCEIFCVDAGWYCAGYWWDGVGEWLPSKERFPGGIIEVFDYIRSKGMLPGLWLELEVMGIKCSLAETWPDECFFMRHGKRVIDHGRYHLDFRHPKVLEHANATVDRLINEYGIDYIKIDYNINIGIGTEIDADSPGDGLLQHNRAYLSWLDGVWERYPDLIIESCASGGMRMNNSMLSRHSIQSCTDQTDYKLLGVIAASCLTAVTPEQCVTWSYPTQDADDEEIIFNMVNTMLMRICQSGPLAGFSPSKLALVKEGITCYKKIRDDIRHSLPYWPLGLPKFTHPWASLALKNGSSNYVAVWRRETDQTDCSLPILHLRGKSVKVECIYPKQHNCSWKWDSDNGRLMVSLPKCNSARLFKLESESG